MCNNIIILYHGDTKFVLCRSISESVVWYLDPFSLFCLLIISKRYMVEGEGLDLIRAVQLANLLHLTVLSSVIKLMIHHPCI